MPQTFTCDFESTYSGKIKDAIFTVSCYLNNKSPALIVSSAEGEPIAKCSVNPSIGRVPHGYIVIKDWGENQGMERFLINAGLIEAGDESNPLFPCGMEAAEGFKMKGKLLEAWNKFKQEELSNV